MKDDDVKFALTAIAESIAALAEKQSLIMHILSNELSSLSDADRNKLLQSAQSGIASADRIKLALKSL